MVSSLKRFSKDEVAKERLRIIEFYDEFGERAAIQAFKVNRKTIFVWKKRLKMSRNQLESLIPSSTTPLTTRKMLTHPKVLEHIKSLREQHPHIGKEKIKPLLDKYCLKEGIPTIKESTIGKVIKRNNFFFQKRGRVYHNPDHKTGKRGKRLLRTRVKYAPKPIGFGYLEMDTVLRFIDGIRYYFYSAIDVKGKFAFSLPYKNLNSQNTTQFFQKLQEVCPCKIKIVQTDNGLEFLGDFDSYLKRENILHVFIYPRCPRINGVVERYQKTLQEDLIDENLDIIHNPKLFNDKLIDFLLFYNTQRVHKSLGLVSPIDYLLMKGEMSKMSVTYTRT